MVLCTMKIKFSKVSMSHDCRVIVVGWSDVCRWCVHPKANVWGHMSGHSRTGQPVSMTCMCWFSWSLSHSMTSISVGLDFAITIAMLSQVKCVCTIRANVSMLGLLPERVIFIWTSLHCRDDLKKIVYCTRQNCEKIVIDLKVFNK